MRKAVAFLKRAEAVEQRIDPLLSQIELYKSLTQRVTASWEKRNLPPMRATWVRMKMRLFVSRKRAELENFDAGVSGCR